MSKRWCDLLTDTGQKFSSFRGYLLLLTLGRWQEAIGQLRNAGGESARNPDLLANLGYAYALAGSQKKAIRCTRQAVLLAPRNLKLAFNLVGLLLGNGKSDDAFD